MLHHYYSSQYYPSGTQTLHPSFFFLKELTFVHYNAKYLFQTANATCSSTKLN